jgi:hypothetical protein
LLKATSETPSFPLLLAEHAPAAVWIGLVIAAIVFGILVLAE